MRFIPLSRVTSGGQILKSSQKFYKQLCVAPYVECHEKTYIHGFRPGLTHTRL